MSGDFSDNKMTLKEVIYVVSLIIAGCSQYVALTNRVEQIVNDAKLENQSTSSKINALTLQMTDLKNDFKQHVQYCVPMYANKPKELKIESDNTNIN